MKIAIFHNYLDNIGGAEIVNLTLARELNADIYTTNIDKEKIIKMGFEDVLPRIISIGNIPIKAPFRHQAALWKFRNLNLGNKYDFYIICGDWAVSGAVNNRPNLWYVHSPLNELWQWKDYIRNVVLKIWQRNIFDIWVIFNRMLTKRYSRSVDVWVCNSSNTQGRVRKYYNKEATIINPPIDTKKYFNNGDNGYWLSVNRLTAPKRIEIQIEAFNKIDSKLIIVGSYEKGAQQFEEYKNKTKSLLNNSNIKIIHWVDDKELKKMYSECKGFITTSMDEDFGMTIVEAMASGKPVIAPNEGGYKESVIDKENGILIDDINGEKLADAIIEIEEALKIDPDKYKSACIARSKLFDVDIFIKKIKRQLNW